MNAARNPRWLAAALLLAVALPSPSAEAVIPSAFGPIQALIVILPQLLLALAGLLVAIFKPRTYKLLGAYLWTHKVFTVILVGVIALLILGPSGLFGSRAIAAEQVGAPWAAFRGGPERRGAVPGAKGPLAQPRILWKTSIDDFAAALWIDSSPAVVGNRLYVGGHIPSALGGVGTGMLVCLDTETGREIWRYTGKGDLNPPLRGIFSSPAVWVDQREGETAPTARYIVCGEGYHNDRNGRLICLDLEPVRKSNGKEPPRLRWYVQNTDHVESAPCIFDGRVFFGGGDDGVYSVELETGKILWRLEGGPYYEVAEGPQVASLAKLVGKRVIAAGTVRRVYPRPENLEDPGYPVLDVREAKDHDGPPVTSQESGKGFDRTVTGKVVEVEKGTARPDRCSRLRIEVEAHYPDAESPPIGVTVDNEPRVIFGSGVDGQAVVCVKGRTGDLVWKTPTPYPAFGATSVSGDRLFIGLGKGSFIASDPNPAGFVLCLSIKDGKEIWKAPTGDTILGAVAVCERRGYGCARDGNVYILDLADGRVIGKYPTGAPMVCSPAVTADSIYAATDAGKVFCLDRATGGVRWSLPLTPGNPIISSPAAASGKLFIGTRSKFVYCLADAPLQEIANKPPKRWMGPGGDAGRTGCADDRGLPQFQPDQDGNVIAKWPTPEALKQPVKVPLWAEGNRVGVPFENRTVVVDAATGNIIGPMWGCLSFEVVRVPPYIGSLARAHGLIFASLKGEPAILACLSEGECLRLWSANLETAPTGPPTVAGDKVFVTTAGREKAKGFVEAHKVVDGSLVWRKELDDVPLAYAVAAGDWVAVPTADDKIAVFRASDGKPREPIPVAGKPVAPALWKDTLVIAGEGRIAAYDLSANEWLWNYKDQDNIGTATGQPVLCNETIWVGTTKQGLVAIGVPPVQAKK